MAEEVWDRVDRYFNENLLKDYYSRALEEQNRAGLPDINITPTQGMLLNIISRTLGSRTILEIGTLGGYSSIWLASSISGQGKLVSLEVSKKHAEVARKNIEAAGLGEKVDIMLGSALETLPKLEGSEYAPFDMVFIDADKPNNPDYLKWALRLTKSGSIIVIDNAVRAGKVIDSNTTDDAVLGVRNLVDMISKSDKVDSTAIQTVGSKGYDGFIIMRVR